MIRPVEKRAVRPELQASINTIRADAKMLNQSINAAAAAIKITAQEWRIAAEMLNAATAMLITPARSFSGHGRFADVIQVFAWVAENTSDYAITQRDRKDGAGLRADDLIEFQIILSGDESEAVAFQLRWLGGSE